MYCKNYFIFQKQTKQTKQTNKKNTTSIHLYLKKRGFSKTNKQKRGMNEAK